MVRHSVQVLLFDEGDRVLLLQSADPDSSSTLWRPVGGGIEAGETVQDAARREVAEETGLPDLELGPELWHRRHLYTWLGKRWDSRERWFLARVDHFAPTEAGMTEQEARHHLEHRWWTYDALATTTERFTPHDLPERVANLLTDGPPAIPLDLHH